MNSLEKWFQTYKEGMKICDVKTPQNLINKENESISSLKRGVFAKKNLKAKQYLSKKIFTFLFLYLKIN